MQKNETTQKAIPIIYNQHGIGNTYDDCIQLHEGLKKPEYELLRDYILKHELEHTQGGKVRAHDLMHDFTDLLLKPKDISKLYFKFYFEHFFQGAWWQSMPFTIYKRQVYWDLSKLWQISITTGFIIFILWLIL